MIPVIGLGAGGHARVVIETLQAMGGYEWIGLLDPQPELWGSNVLGVPVLADDRLLPTLRRQGIRHACIGVGSVGSTAARQRLYQTLQTYEFEPLQLLHPRAVVSPSAMLGAGVQILPAAVVHTAVTLGCNVLVNTGALVEHDCVIGDHVHIATGARLASTVHVGAGAHIGVGAVVRQCLHIGRNAVVGAGAVVVKDVPDGVTVVGVPARPLHRATYPRQTGAGSIGRAQHPCPTGRAC